MSNFEPKKQRDIETSNQDSQVSSFESFFWSGLNNKTKQIKPKKKFNSSFLVYSIMIIALSGLIIGRAYQVKASIKLDLLEANSHLNAAFSQLEKGEFDQSQKSSEQAKADLEEIKLSLQSWGQNSRYLKLINYRSQYVDMEYLLEAASGILEASAESKNIFESYSQNYSNLEIRDGEDLNLKLDMMPVSNYLTGYEQKIRRINNTLERLQNNQTASNIYLKDLNIGRLEQLCQKLIDQSQKIQNEYIPILDWFAGKGSKRELLILFQNNAEIRGSGGFLGSFATVATENLTLGKLDFETNIYKLDNAAKDKVDFKAPSEYQVLSGGKMYLRDANYAVSGPESFSKILELYSAESGKTANGIVSLDATLITEMLKITGPIRLDAYNLEINSDNFLTETTREVEINYFERNGAKQENEPKKVLADLMPLLIKKVTTELNDTHNRTKIIQLIQDNISAKHIQFYSQDAAIQELIEKNNFGGKVIENGSDYFLSHSTNIGGGKSSQNIVEEVYDTVTIGEDGKIGHHITISRTHQGDGVWPDYYNLNLMRILVPDNSQITNFNIISGNFEANGGTQSQGEHYYVGNEAGKQKISFWMNTQPKESSKLEFGYVSGYRLDLNDKKYQFLIQKQAGTPAYNYHLTVRYPKNWRLGKSLLWGEAAYSFYLDKDRLIKLNFN